MSKTFPVMALLLVNLLGGGSSCGKQDQKSEPPPSASDRKLPLVVVPEEVEGKWKAVKIAVRDTETQQEQIFTVNIGESFTVAHPGPTAEVLTFLPSFIMDGTIRTSASNDTRNPAIQIRITENGKKVFEGWLFSKFPAFYASQHPRYNFNLIDFIPVDSGAGKHLKKGLTSTKN